jgi:hypothetical protein
VLLSDSSEVQSLLPSLVPQLDQHLSRYIKFEAFTPNECKEILLNNKPCEDGFTSTDPKTICIHQPLMTETHTHLWNTMYITQIHTLSETLCTSQRHILSLKHYVHHRDIYTLWNNMYITETYTLSETLCRSQRHYTLSETLCTSQRHILSLKHHVHCTNSILTLVITHQDTTAL